MYLGKTADCLRLTLRLVANPASGKAAIGLAADQDGWWGIPRTRYLTVPPGAICRERT